VREIGMVCEHAQSVECLRAVCWAWAGNVLAVGNSRPGGERCSAGLAPVSDESAVASWRPSG